MQNTLLSIVFALVAIFTANGKDSTFLPKTPTGLDVPLNHEARIVEVVSAEGLPYGFIDRGHPDGTGFYDAGVWASAMLVGKGMLVLCTNSPIIVEEELHKQLSKFGGRLIQTSAITVMSSPVKTYTSAVIGFQFVEDRDLYYKYLASKAAGTAEKPELSDIRVYLPDSIEPSSVEKDRLKKSAEEFSKRLGPVPR